jgi:outer membrane protein OmpA-like peptidoglycan-associated protein
MDHRSGKFVGAGIGGLVGGLIGADMDKRRCELAKVAKQYNLDMSFATVDSQGAIVEDAALNTSPNAEDIKKTAIGSIVSIQDHTPEGGHFEPGSDKLTIRAQQYFAAIADSYNARKTAEGIADKKVREDYIRQIASRKLLLVGHTDDTGSSRFNAELSERRAKAVAKFLSEHGISLDSLYFQGAGESYPIADNSTEEGRARNRRVEFVELSDDANLRKYLNARKPKYEYYRPADTGSQRDMAAVSVPSGTASEKTASTIIASNKRHAKAHAASRSAPSAVATASPAAKTSGKTRFIDFGGQPLGQAVAVANVGRVEAHKSWFSLVSPAYADEPAVLHDCSQDRPRVSGAVKALRDGKQYETSEYLPGLYGKTWTDNVNGHQVIINKISVLRDDAAVARLPEFKVYANYNPSVNRNPVPTISTTPEVNTYRGSNGVLYRMFIEGNSGLKCVDILFADNGASAAKAGKLIYLHNNQPYVADFRPTRIQH